MSGEYEYCGLQLGHFVDVTVKLLSCNFSIFFEKPRFPAVDTSAMHCMWACERHAIVDTTVVFVHLDPKQAVQIPMNLAMSFQLNPRGIEVFD
jgi:hypothetical protein